MVETTTVTDESSFVAACSGTDACDLNEGQLSELWELWDEYSAVYGDALLIQVPSWFSENEFEAGRRPYAFGTVEYDDSNSGAVLFSGTDLVNISVVENQVLGETSLPLNDCIEELDVSSGNDYIDEPGTIWIPRSLMDVFERDV